MYIYSRGRINLRNEDEGEGESEMEVEGKLVSRLIWLSASRYTVGLPSD